MPLSTIFLPKVALNVSKNSRNSTKLPVFLPKFSKFHQIWSHWKLNIFLFVHINRIWMGAVVAKMYLPTTKKWIVCVDGWRGFELKISFAVRCNSCINSVTWFGEISPLWHSLGTFWGLILYLAKFWSYCGKNVLPLCKLSLM